MNKKELVEKVAKSVDVPTSEAAATVNAVFDVIADELAHGDSVQIIGFGTFETRNRSARKGRNPQTGEEIDIAASTVPGFKAGKALKDAVKD